jgi:hypothetical protein
VGDVAGVPVGEEFATVGVGAGVEVDVGIGVPTSVGIGVGVGVGATTPFPTPCSFTIALAVPRVASLVTVTVVAKARFEGGTKEIIAVALALGCRIVPACGSSTIENACEGAIVSDVMVSGALPVFAMMNFFWRVATLPNSIVTGVTLSRPNRGLGLAFGWVCCADAEGASANASKTQAQSAARYRRVIAPQVTTTTRTSMNNQEEHKSPLETTESVKTYIIMPKCYLMND